MLDVNCITIERMMTRIVHAISFRVSPGQCVALLGPSGCGKTTILRAVAGLEPYCQGHISQGFQRVAMLFQEPRLLPWRTTAQNIRLVNPHLPESELVTIATSLGLEPEDLVKYPDQLSGGMQQRAALARALATKPDFLIMDEPFSALDHQLRHSLQNLIAKQIEEGLAVLMVTHDRLEALRLGQVLLHIGGKKPATIMDTLTLSTPYVARTRLWLDDHLKHPFFAPGGHP